MIWYVLICFIHSGTVLWISKGAKAESANVVVKLDNDDSDDEYRHREIRTYPYTLVAKTTPANVLFQDDLIAAYVASAISSGNILKFYSFGSFLRIVIKVVRQYQSAKIYLYIYIVITISTLNDYNKASCIRLIHTKQEFKAENQEFRSRMRVVFPNCGKVVSYF